jgi:hypothetical protein
MNNIPLLSQKPLDEFSPEDYHAYVRSMFNKPPKKERTVRIKKPKPPFVWSLTPKGALSLRFNRKPKYLTALELNQISFESGFPLDEVTAKAAKLKVEITTLP